MGVKITNININKIKGENIGNKVNNEKLNGAIIVNSMRRANIPTPMPRRLHTRDKGETWYYSQDEAHRYASLIEKSLGLDKQKRR